MLQWKAMIAMTCIFEKQGCREILSPWAISSLKFQEQTQPEVLSIKSFFEFLQIPSGRLLLERVVFNNSDIYRPKEM